MSKIIKDILNEGSSKEIDLIDDKVVYPVIQKLLKDGIIHSNSLKYLSGYEAAGLKILVINTSKSTVTLFPIALNKLSKMKEIFNIEIGRGQIEIAIRT